MKLSEIVEKPQVQVLGPPSTDQLDRMVYSFNVTHPALAQDALLTLTYWPQYRSAIVNAWGSFNNINRLGPSVIRYVIGRLRHEIPDLDSLKGTRETGARGKKTAFRDRFQTIDVSRIPPIP